MLHRIHQMLSLKLHKTTELMRFLEISPGIQLIHFFICDNLLCAGDKTMILFSLCVCLIEKFTIHLVAHCPTDLTTTFYHGVCCIVPLYISQSIRQMS
jgi:hypothetical protein